MKNKKSFEFAIQKTTDICLFFLFACIPLIINPTAFDYWYKPKIDSIYALIVIILISVGIRCFFVKPSLLLKIKDLPLTVPLVAYGLSAIISTVFSISPKLSLQGDMWRLESVFTLLSYVLLTFMFSSFVTSEKQIRILLKGLLVSSAIVSLYGIIQYSGYNPTEHFIPLFRSNRINSTIGNANFLGKFLVLVLPLFMAHYLTAKTMRARLLLGAGNMLCLCTLVLTFTRASWLGFCAAAVIFFLFAGRKFLREQKKRILVLMLVAVVFIAGTGLYASMRNQNKKADFVFNIKKRLLSSFDLQEGQGVATRLFVWKMVIGLIKERPFFGFGPDTHVKAMRKFNLEYSRKFNDWVIIDRSHNNYLDIALAQGLVGLAAYMSIIITFLVWLRQTIKHEESPPKRIIFCGIFAAFSGCLINDFFIFSVVSVSPTFWALMGLTIAMKNAGNR